MARLPVPGADNGKWGDILNEFLLQAHGSNGTLKDNSVTNNVLAPHAVTTASIASNAITAAAIADGSITEQLLDTNVRTKLNAASGGVVHTSDTSTAPMAFVVDEDDMSSDSATKIPTQQSVKAYVDANTNTAPWPGRVYETEVGDGTNGPYTITHNLGTRSVIVTIYENGANGAEITVNVRHTGINTIVLEPDETWTANQYHVLVVGFVGTSDVAAPSQPTLVVTGQDQTTVSVAVSGASDSVGVTGYKWYRDGAYIASTSGTTYTHTGLTAGISYNFTVTAYDLAGNESVPSNTVSHATDNPPPSVSRSAIGAGQRITSGTTLAWTHTVPAGSSRALIVGVVDSHGTNLSGDSYATHSVTSNLGTGSGSAALTELGVQDIGQFTAVRIGSVRLFGLLNPAVGTHTITVNIADPSVTITQLQGNSVSYTGVKSFGTAVTNFSNSGVALDATVASDTNDMVAIAAAFGANPPSDFSGTTNYSEGANVSGDGDYILIGDGAGAASVNFTTSSNNHRWAFVGINLVTG